MSISETDDSEGRAPFVSRFRTSRFPGFVGGGGSSIPGADELTPTPPLTALPATSNPLASIGGSLNFDSDEGQHEGPADTAKGDPDSVLGRAVLGIVSALPGPFGLVSVLGRGVNTANAVANANDARGVLGMDPVSPAEIAMGFVKGADGLAAETPGGLAGKSDPSLGYGVPGVDPTAGAASDSGDDGDGTIICTELYCQGLLKHGIYQGDVKWGASLSPITRDGYHFWARPIVARMKRDKRFARCVAVLAHPVIYAGARKAGVGPGSRIGVAVLSIGLPACWLIGCALSVKGYQESRNAA